MRRVLTQAGDTIVEVLVAMTIISMILGGAYLTARHSLTATEQAQERGEALSIAQGQVETLRSLAQNITPIEASSPLAHPPNSNIFNEADVFCLDNAGAIHEGVVDTSGINYIIGSFPGGDSDANYQLTGGTHPCAVNQSGAGVSYDVAIDRCDVRDDASGSDCSSSNQTILQGGLTSGYALFTVYVHWDSLANGRDQVSLEYRLYPGGS